MPDATLREQIGTEVTYSFKHEQRHKFERLFKQIEINKERLAIGNYGLSDTTLEEVRLQYYFTFVLYYYFFLFYSLGFSMGYRIS